MMLSIKLLHSLHSFVVLFNLIALADHYTFVTLTINLFLKRKKMKQLIAIKLEDLTEPHTKQMRQTIPKNETELSLKCNIY